MRRHLRYLAQEFLFLRRKILVSARFDLPPPSLGWHGEQSLHHISHFLPRNRTLPVVQQPVICRAGISSRFVVHELHRPDLVVYASRSLRPWILRILLLRVVTRISVATAIPIGARWPIRIRPVVRVPTYWVRSGRDADLHSCEGNEGCAFINHRKLVCRRRCGMVHFLHMQQSIERYEDLRLEQGGANATVNREIALLKQAFNLGRKATPPKVTTLLSFPERLAENNKRKGFIGDGSYPKLTGGASELWFRALLEMATTYAWRKSELINLQCRQVDVVGETIRLDGDETKSGEPREVAMNATIKLLLRELTRGKKPDEYVFTRENGRRVRDFRGTRAAACIAAGLGTMVCRSCQKPVDGEKCECGARGKALKYVGQLFHDLRRTGARNLRIASVSEGVIMEIGGWSTRSVFECYNIKSKSDSVDALKKLDQNRAVTLEKIELERQQEEHEERNPTFEFSTNTVPIDVAASGIGKSGKVN